MNNFCDVVDKFTRTSLKGTFDGVSVLFTILRRIVQNLSRWHKKRVFSAGLRRFLILNLGARVGSQVIRTRLAAAVNKSPIPSSRLIALGFKSIEAQYRKKKRSTLESFTISLHLNPMASLYHLNSRTSSREQAFLGASRPLRTFQRPITGVTVISVLSCVPWSQNNAHKQSKIWWNHVGIMLKREAENANFWPRTMDSGGIYVALDMTIPRFALIVIVNIKSEST